MGKSAAEQSACVTAVIAGALAFGADAHAQDDASWALVYEGDVLSSWSDAVNGRARALESTHLTFDAVHSGLTLHADINATSGAHANDDIGALQGIDNIEVDRARTRLYEFWAEAEGFGGRASLRLGVQELNQEFYSADSAGLLINPSFGLPIEISATGGNGPSTFPYTALAARARFAPSEHVELKLGVFNADARTIGDPGGLDASFDNGVLSVAEAAWTLGGRMAFGAWRYSKDQPNLSLENNGDVSQGAYALIEHRLWGDDESARGASGFVRVGFADGDTSPVSQGWQAGVLVTHVLKTRPDSALTIGLSGARLGEGGRANLLADGGGASAKEMLLEISYSDAVTPWLKLQPDLQIVTHPGGARDHSTALVAGLRLKMEFGGAL